MAFRQPTHPLPHHQHYTSSTLAQDISIATQIPQPLEDSQEWVLFSPSAPSTDQTHTASTEHTAGLSQFSNLGSLDTAAGRSDEELEDKDEKIGSDATEAGGEADEEEELDSLDSHLHAFREPSSVYNRPSHRGSHGASLGAVLPTHDGLGAFAASSPRAQEQLWQYEQFNPRRRRRPSEPDDVKESERHQRIQAWRMEQSRVLLDEIERETRRRRMSRASSAVAKSVAVEAEDDSVTMGISELKEGSGKGSSADPAATEKVDDGVGEDNESFWKRLTRRVIRDLMGIDDAVLSVLFGESLPAEPGSTVNATNPVDHMATDDMDTIPHTSTWEDRLLERIAHELGILVNQFTEHPGAFSTYLRSQPPSPDHSVQHNTRRRRRSQALSQLGLTSAPIPSFNLDAHFNPSLPTQTHQTTLQSPSSHAALWGIEEASDETSLSDADEVLADRAEAERLRREREYWERDLDLKTVLRYLRGRFTSRSHNANYSPSTTATSAAAAAHAREALIRQHHPLISHYHSGWRRGGPITGLMAAAPVGIRRSASSCASQSTKGKKTSRSGSSRHYWDLGGSVGSVVAPGSSAGVGAWGEV